MPVDGFKVTPVVGRVVVELEAPLEGGLGELLHDARTRAEAERATRDVMRSRDMKRDPFQEVRMNVIDRAALPAVTT
jgi:hypothetical protein